MLAKGGGTAPTLIRQEMIPGLSAGLIAPAAPLAGQAFPQPVVSAGPGQECLLDDLIEPCFRLVVASPCDTPALRALAAAHGIRVIVLDATAVTAANPDDALHIAERDGLIKAWFERSGTCGALVRPDHYVFGAFASTDAGVSMIAAFAGHGLAAEPPAAGRETTRPAQHQAAQAT